MSKPYGEVGKRFEPSLGNTYRAHEISSLRPKLKVVAPLTHFICVGYAIVNFLIALGLYTLYSPTSSLVIVNNLITFQVWGLVFLGLSFTKTYGLIKNDWNVLRKGLLAGILVKSVWLFALAFRVVENPGTILIAVIWLFFAYIQTGTYIFFIPNIKGVHDRTSP